MRPDRPPEPAVRTYVVEVDEEETVLPDVPGVCELLQQIAARDTADIWVIIDHGPRRRTWLEWLFGVSSSHDAEACFHLEKSGDAATLMFFDRAWSEYRASDPAYPIDATPEQRMAISGGEPEPAPLERCLQAARAFRAAAECLRSGTRPDWLTYRYVR